LRFFDEFQALVLLKRPPSSNTTFLPNLDLYTFEHLQALDEALKKLQSFDREARIERILHPDPTRAAKREEIIQFLEGLSAEQFGEAMITSSRLRSVLVSRWQQTPRRV
jgi:hypothetical protein